MNIARFYTKHASKSIFKQAMSKWIWYVKEMKISQNLKNEFDQVKRRDILMRKVLESKICFTKEYLRGIVRKWRLQVIKLNKLYQKRKDDSNYK